MAGSGLNPGLSEPWGQRIHRQSISAMEEIAPAVIPLSSDALRNAYLVSDQKDCVSLFLVGRSAKGEKRYRGDEHWHFFEMTSQLDQASSAGETVLFF